MEERISFADRAMQYARAVVAGRIPACKWHRLACQRHLSDLERSASPSAWPYAFNPDLTDASGKTYRPAERICRFAELMPHIKGDWAAKGERIVLEGWQVFCLASVFGWVHRETGKRRFRVADLFVPRKNAKSTLAAVIGNFLLAVDGEFGAEIYSGATSQDQAFEVFRPALLMARATPRFLERYGVRVNASNLSVADTNSKFEPVIGNPGDGASPSCAIVDEYHEHKTPDLYETMQTGMGARSQPLMLVITTAGTDISGPCYMHQQELQKILEGVVENDQRFGIIFGIDEGDDWTSEDALLKANPNYGISVDADFLKLQQRDAQADPRKQNTFKTKHLNQWVAAASPWLNLHKLQQAGDPRLTLESMRRKTCVAGLDLASKIDIASRVLLFREEIDGEDHYFAISRNYLPEAAVDKPENAHYQAWVTSGHITTTPGNMISLRQIQDDLMEDAETVVISEIAMDAWGSREIAPNLQEEGFQVVDIPMQVRHLSEPMKSIAALVDAGRFHHDGNPAYVWMLSNVECKEDRNDNIFPRKQRPQNKIDAAVATIIAKARSIVPAAENVDDFLNAPLVS
ncbi:MAG: terminase TerL endonuclease subunit [Candidatus Accumulibacter phosphatis]